MCTHFVFALCIITFILIPIRGSSIGQIQTKTSVRIDMVEVCVKCNIKVRKDEREKEIEREDEGRRIQGIPE